MPEILRARGARGLVAALVGLSLIAAACGGGSTAEVSAARPEVTPEGDDATGSSGGEASTSDADGGATDDAAAADDAGTTEEEAAADGDGGEDAAPAEAPIENLFPDVDVVNIVDGSTVNLSAELGGGDLPVLLWFWAPH